ncbi:MAG TPA: gliding-motility protein MglA, partial [Verrucomicrobiae bacterium]|nr:gliding-motility protein MglA [Verrucomicrobiae bacterium]
MALINQASKEIQVKIVYYGPALCGKTTNLVKVHENVLTTGEKGKLVS